MKPGTHTHCNGSIIIFTLITILSLTTGCARAPRETITTPISTLVSTPVGTKNPVAFGILAVIPGTSGSISDPKAVAAIASAGARYMRVSFDWAISEPKQGNISYNTSNDRVIQRIEKAGLKILPTLYVGSGWMNGNLPDRGAGGSRSYPPDDLSKNWSDSYGYSPSYYHFVEQFFTHYRGHFDYVAIENEANSSIFWGGTAEEYVRLLKTAYKAIKAADPNVTIMDSGFVSAALGLCIAGDEIKTDFKTKEEVTQFAITYYSAETGQVRITSEADLDRALNNAKSQEQCRRINYMLDNMGGSVDAVNFHFYEDYRALPDVVEWLRLRTARAGYSTLIVSNEMGSRGMDVAFAESSAYAQQVFKKIVTGVSVGLQVIIWFSADSVEKGKDKVSLFGDQGVMRPAAETYKLVVQTLSSGYTFKTMLSNGPQIYQYTFEDTHGVPSLEAIWAESMVESVSLQAPFANAQARQLDYVDQSQNLVIKNDTANLTLVEAPFFVFWEEN